MVTQVNADTENLTPEELAAKEAAALEKGNPPAPKEEEKLLAGKYKTVEELEQGYGNSNKEATRMAQEINNLKLELQQAQTPAQKKEVADKIVNLSDHFDEKTAEVLNKYVDGKMQTFKDDFHKTNKEQTDFEKNVSESWEETKKLYPDVANPKSKLSIRATEILSERRLAQVDEKGVTHLISPFAYRMAVEAAVTEIGRQPPESPHKGRIGAIQGRGSRSVGTGRLTYEQYQALPSDEERDAYDAQYKNN